jgi:hypothetical protein
MIRHFLRVGIVASLCAGAMPDMAAAQRAFDGQWSVLIVTQRGDCDRAYRYGVTISNGRVIYNGGGASLSGRVSANGAVSVRVSGGGGIASGSGRLTRNAGRGSWSGQSGGNRCSGYWTASRSG